MSLGRVYDEVMTVVMTRIYGNDLPLGVHAGRPHPPERHLPEVQPEWGLAAKTAYHP